MKIKHYGGWHGKKVMLGMVEGKEDRRVDGVNKLPKCCGCPRESWRGLLRIIHGGDKFHGDFSMRMVGHDCRNSRKGKA